MQAIFRTILAALPARPSRLSPSLAAAVPCPPIAVLPGDQRP